MTGARSILVLGGVTAAGKTGAAITLARRLGGELIGADSVQVYRGFDIGSAKPTAEELEGLPHHLLDVIDADEAIDAARFAELADAAIADVHARGKVPIVVGGTGLWLRTLLRGLVALPEVDPDLRARLEGERERVGAAAMHQRLAAVDAAMAERLHANDAVRVLRALEVFEQTGTPLSELQRQHALGAPRHRAYCVALDLDRERLYDRIRARLAEMIARGLVEEVRGLLARWGRQVRPMGAVGYKEIAAHVEGELGLEDALAAAYKATRIYTRRQRTWFRGDPSGYRFMEAAELCQGHELTRIERFLSGVAPDENTSSEGTS